MEAHKPRNQGWRSVLFFLFYPRPVIGAKFAKIAKHVFLLFSVHLDFYNLENFIMSVHSTWILASVLAVSVAFFSNSCCAQLGSNPTWAPAPVSGNILSRYSAPAFSGAVNSDYYPFVITRRADREMIRYTPVELRPNRPLHFYGNMVRRNYPGQAPLR
jgi:hypothetical protein